MRFGKVTPRSVSGSNSAGSADELFDIVGTEAIGLIIFIASPEQRQAVVDLDRLVVLVERRETAMHAVERHHRFLDRQRVHFPRRTPDEGAGFDYPVMLGIIPGALDRVGKDRPLMNGGADN